MSHLSLTEAREQFPSVIRDAENGFTTVITKRGIPVAKVVPIPEFESLMEALKHE